MHYVTETELDRRTPNTDELDAIIAGLADYHPALSTATSGNLTITLTIPADTLRQAATTTLAVVGADYGAPLTLSVQPEEVRDARLGWVPIPDLVGATEAAQILGLSRQRIQQLVTAGKLPATRIGRELAIPRAALNR